VVERLKKDHEITGFWFNPNIQPEQEYKSRKKSLEGYAGVAVIPLVVNEESGSQEWFDKIRGLSGDKRCEACYQIRLRKTAEQADILGCEFFSTTLLSSPYQKHEKVKRSGELAQAGSRARFLYIDFRDTYYEGKDIAYKSGSYMQKYCGCIFSIEEKKKRKNTD